MMRTILIVTFLCFYNAYPQLRGTLASGETYSIDTLNGMHNGKCLLLSEDGKVRLEGYFRNNQKIGIWTIRDTLGQLRMRTSYKNSYIFNNLKLYNSRGSNIRIIKEKEYLVQRITDSLKDAAEKAAIYTNFTTLKTEPKIKYPAQDIGFRQYVFERDSLNVLQYPYIANRDIIYNTTLFTYIDNITSNHYLFKSEVMNSVKSYIQNNPSPEIYTTSNFAEKIPANEALAKLGTLKNIIGFKLKEIFYFDRQRLHSSIRIIGICPILLHPDGQEYEELFWIYYPSLRPYLSITNSLLPDNPEIATIEDIFHFRHFESFAYYRMGKGERESDLENFKFYKHLKPKRTSIEGELLHLEWKIWNRITY